MKPQYKITQIMIFKIIQDAISLKVSKNFQFIKKPDFKLKWINFDETFQFDGRLNCILLPFDRPSKCINYVHRTWCMFFGRLNLFFRLSIKTCTFCIRSLIFQNVNICAVKILSNLITASRSKKSRNETFLINSNSECHSPKQTFHPPKNGITGLKFKLFNIHYDTGAKRELVGESISVE